MQSKYSPSPQELQTMILLSVAQVRALRTVCVLLWQQQEIRLHATDSIEVVLERLENEQREIMLASISDSDPNLAARMKEFVDKVFEKKPSA